MRQKSSFARLIGVCLGLGLLSFAVFAQNKNFIPPAAFDEQAEIQTQRVEIPAEQLLPIRILTFDFRNFPNLRIFSSRNYSSASVNTFSFRRIPENFSGRYSASIRYGNGIQSTLSTATGLTQISESRILEKGGLVSSNGQRPTSNNFTVNGAALNLGASADETSIAGNAGALPTLTASGGTNGLFVVSGTSEVTVKTMSSAREQRIPGSQISFLSRSGTNIFRGSLFETVGNGKLNANDFFANAKGLKRAPQRLNQFGGTLGGFIVKDNAFFFANYEGLRLRQPAFAVSEVPDLFSRQNASAAIRPLFNAFPVANGANTTNGFAEFSSVFTNPAAHDIFGLRIEAQPNDQLKLSGIFNRAVSKAVIRGDQDFSLNTLRESRISTNWFSLTSTYVVNSRMVIYGSVNFSRNDLKQRFLLDDFGGANLSSTLFTLPSDFLKYDLNGKNAALARSLPNGTIFDQFQTKGETNLIINKHNLAFGADFRQISLDLSPNLTERSVLFTGVSLNGTAALLNEINRFPGDQPKLRNFSLYAQDEWRVKNGLNLNLGLRWDMDFAPDFPVTGTVFQNSSPQMPNRYKNFAPRAALAFQPLDNQKSIIRFGIGLYYDFGNSASSEIFANSFPFAAGNFARNTDFTAAPSASLKPLLAFSDDLKTPRALHIFGEFQQEFIRNHIFTVTYTASWGQKLFLTRTLFDADPNFNFIRLTDNSAKSNYQSLQFRFERRFSSGFSVNARYALSKSKDNFSPDRWRENNFVSADPETERGSSDFDVRHQLSIFGIYDIPVFFDGGFKKFLTKNWSISAFANTRTGFPVNVTYSNVTNVGQELRRPDLAPDVPLYLTENGIKRLNPNAFATPVENRQGTLGRNALRGFSLFQLDTSLQKRIKFTNNAGLNLTINFYNLLNNTNFADLKGNLGTLVSTGNFRPDSYFGRTTGTFGSGNFTPFYLYGGARTIQLSAKFVF